MDLGSRPGSRPGLQTHKKSLTQASVSPRGAAIPSRSQLEASLISLASAGGASASEFKQLTAEGPRLNSLTHRYGPLRQAKLVPHTNSRLDLFMTNIATVTSSSASYAKLTSSMLKHISWQQCQPYARTRFNQHAGAPGNQTQPIPTTSTGNALYIWAGG